eukprot:scaffold150358_cov29-Prasinocladus_malaysianus.AAC.1
MGTAQVRSHVAELLNRYAGRKVMLGVDRLDMIKGIPQKLLAYEKFLEEHPEWRDKLLGNVLTSTSLRAHEAISLNVDSTLLPLAG